MDEILKNYINAYEEVFIKGNRSDNAFNALDNAGRDIDKYFPESKIPSYWKGAYKFCQEQLAKSELKPKVDKMKEKIEITNKEYIMAKNRISVYDEEHDLYTGDFDEYIIEGFDEAIWAEVKWLREKILLEVEVRNE